MNEHRLQEGRGLIATTARRDELRRMSQEWRSWTVAGAPLAELEALVSGYLWPFDGYGSSRASAAGVHRQHGVDESIAPALHVPLSFAEQVVPGSTVALRDPEGVLLAALSVEEIREHDRSWYLEGPVEGVELPAHDDFRDLRSSPPALADRARALGYGRVLAFFPQHLLHAGVRAALMDAAERLDAAILVLVAASGTEHDELSDFARVRALLISAGLLPSLRTIVGVVPLPVSSLPATNLQRVAVVARNCGASDLAINGTDLGLDDTGIREVAGADLSIRLVPVSEWVFSPDRRQFVPPESSTGAESAPPAPEAIFASPASAPEWLLTKEEKSALERAHVPRSAQGFTVFFTGLSGSGKSTIARALHVRLMEVTGRPVTLLDGDRVRRHLSSELGFSREHRDLNILRIGWVAAEITRHGGIAVCAPIAPYDTIRRRVRGMVEMSGGFLLVHVSTPLETCEARDRKGLYAKARTGLLPQFTGISDPYEAPVDAAVTVDTRFTSVDEACSLVLAALTRQGYLSQ